MQTQQTPPMQRMALTQMHTQQMQQLVAQHNAQIQQAGLRLRMGLGYP